jgi:hypothetical protein
VVSSSAVAFEYADRSHLITAAAGDTNLVFVAEPLNQQIAVLDRFTGLEVAEVPAPLGGLSSSILGAGTKTRAIGGARFGWFSEPGGAVDCARLRLRL